MPPTIHDLTGNTYGKLTVTKYVGRHKKQTIWQCTCTCGSTKNYIAGNLVGGYSTKCKQCAYINFSKARKQTSITHNNQTHTITEWAKILGITPALIHSRNHRGHTTEQILDKTKYKRLKTKQLTNNRQTHTITEWAKILGLTRQALHLRLNNPKWTQERALTATKLPIKRI